MRSFRLFIIFVRYFFFFFFFSSRRRHTRCSRDWSSDVCSSDLCRGRDSAQFLWCPPGATAALANDSGASLQPQNTEFIAQCKKNLSARCRKVFHNPAVRTLPGEAYTAARTRTRGGGKEMRRFMLQKATILVA